MNKRELLFYQFGGRCFYCGQKIQIENMHIDHMIPKSKGGSNGDNLVASCAECNLVKGDLDVEEFRNKIENLLFKDVHGRMIQKYYHVRPRKIMFYFEKQKGEI